MSHTLEKTAQGSAFGATLLIAGCCIGAGMIGLPVASALAGFIPSTIAMVLCYGFATGTGLLILEATLWFDQHVNLLSLANFALGKMGRLLTWLLFLFLFYCLFVAYIDGGGQLSATALSSLLPFAVPREVGIVCCVGFVGIIVYAGTQAVSLINRLCLVGSGLSYCALISFGLPNVETHQLLHMDFYELFSAIPVLLVCFGYQNLIPTLVYYVKRNHTQVRTAIFVGNLIPFLIYSLWDYVILGILPNRDPATLAEMIRQSDLVTGLLAQSSGAQSVLFFAETFSLFAILNPFIANTLSFVDFLKDGLKGQSGSLYTLSLYGLVLIPPTLLTLFCPHLFLKALGYAGGCADVMLFGILPALIVWIGRYIKRREGPYQVAGGKAFLLAILLVSLGLLFLRK